MKAQSIATAFLLSGLASSAPVTTPLFSRGSSSGYSSGDTANDIVDGVCAPLTLIFARGSTESGNIGTVVGPGLCSSLIESQGANGVACQGVDYPASIQGNFDLGKDGGPTMAKLAKQALSQCPDTKLALSGYSQGSMVVHEAVQSEGLSADDVAAVVLFGDPELGQSVGSVPSSRLKEYCASGDGVCETHTFTITAAHLSYGSDTSEAAAWIVTTAGPSDSSNGTATATSSDSGSSTESGAAGASTSSASSTSGSTSGLDGLGGLGSLSGLGSGTLPTGLSSLGGEGGGSSELGSLGSLGGSSGSSGLGSLEGLGGSSSGSSGLGGL